MTRILRTQAASTERLVTRMLTAAEMANSKVLMHPARSPAIVETSNEVVVGVRDFNEMLGIEAGTGSPEARRWVDAAGESLDKARVTGAKGVGAARQLGTEGLSQVKSVKEKLSGRLAGRRVRRDDVDSGSE